MRTGSLRCLGVGLEGIGQQLPVGLLLERALVLAGVHTCVEVSVVVVVPHLQSPHHATEPPGASHLKRAKIVSKGCCQFRASVLCN